jgi:hypothetical protein
VSAKESLWALSPASVNFPNTIISRDNWIVSVSPNFDLVFKYDPLHKAYGCVFSNHILNKLRSVHASGDCYYKDYHAMNHTKLMTANLVTVAINEAKYTSSQLKRARKARELMARLYHPSDEQ